MTEKTEKKGSRSVYGKFGTYYDMIYNNFIDYTGDCDFIEKIYNKFSQIPEEKDNYDAFTILDLGCGTGNHAVEFASRGYNVTGVDLSESVLISAKTKLETLPGSVKKPEFINKNIKDIDFDHNFDLVTALFGVLSYLQNDQELTVVLGKVRGLLNPGRLLLGEIWQNSGVLPEFSDERTGKDPENQLEIIRKTFSKTPEGARTTEVKMDFLLNDQKTGKNLDSFSETHYLHSFDLDDFTNFLSGSGFLLIDYYDADKKQKNFIKPNYKTLRTFFVAKADSQVSGIS